MTSEGHSGGQAAAARRPSARRRATAPGGTTGWDFFLSYTSADRAWAEWIAWQLEDAGYTVLVQAWDFVPGSHWTSRMDEGIRGAERTVAVLSHAYLNSVYGAAEWQAVFRNDPEGFARKLIPVRVEDCPRPGLLDGVVSFDLFGLPPARARTWLLDQIAAVLAGRAKPDTEPMFPGAVIPPTSGTDAPEAPAPSFPIAVEDDATWGRVPRNAGAGAGGAEGATADRTTVATDLGNISAPGRGPAVQVAAFQHGRRARAGSKEVNAVTFAPGGRLLATASDDRTVGVWDLVTGKRTGTLPHSLEVTAVAFSPDGRLLATGGYNDAGVWDPATSKRAHTLRHTGQVVAVAFSPDGRLLATASLDRANQKTAGVWDLATSTRTHTVPHTGWVFAAAFSPDGRHLATGGEDPAAGVWDLATNTAVQTLNDAVRVVALAFSTDGGLLAATGDGQTADVWDLTTNRPVHTVPCTGRGVVVAFSTDGRQLAVASDDHTVDVWDLTTDTRTHTVTHSDQVGAVAFSPDARLLAVAGGGNRAVVWDLRPDGPQSS